MLFACREPCSTVCRNAAVLQAIWLITTGARESAFRNIKTIAECLADELINAAKGSSNRCVGVDVVCVRWFAAAQASLGLLASIFKSKAKC